MLNLTTDRKDDEKNLQAKYQSSPNIHFVPVCEPFNLLNTVEHLQLSAKKFGVEHGGYHLFIIFHSNSSGMFVKIFCFYFYVKCIN